MALNQDAERKIKLVKLDDLYHNDEPGWLIIVQECYDYVKKAFKPGVTIRPDDVAKFLYPSMEVDDKLNQILSAKKLTQKYWVRHFTDYIIDRTWFNLQW